MPCFDPGAAEDAARPTPPNDFETAVFITDCRERAAARGGSHCTSAEVVEAFWAAAPELHRSLSQRPEFVVNTVLRATVLPGLIATLQNAGVRVVD